VDKLAFYDGAPLPVLRELLGSDDPRQRADAACTLGDRLRTHEIAALERELHERLAALLADAVPMVRFEAAIALAEARDARATPILLGGLSSRVLRLDAIRALGTAGDRAAVAPLGKLMRRWLMPWADRLQAAAALCALGDPEGAAYLKVRLESRRAAESAAAIHFLAESRHPEARALLEAIVADRRHARRDVAVRALGLLRDPRSRGVLEAAREQADDELLGDIEGALKLLDAPPCGQ
jgi:HEAT repeat protein